jgi:hypothetical protein
MKKSALATLLATALSVGAAYAAAPPTGSPPATAPGGAVGVTQGDVEAKQPSNPNIANITAFTLQLADATKLKDWIMQQKTASVAAPAGFNVEVGQTLPTSIMLTAIPASAGVTVVGMNQYAVIDNKIVLADPMTKKIVYVFS